MTLTLDPASLQAEDLPISLGRYELLSVLGRGGMGVVFGARLQGPAGFSKPVALKLLSLQEGGPTREDFFQEARLGGLLWHPNLVGIHDCGVEEGHPFIVMDWVENVTVARLLHLAAPLSTSAVLDLALQTCAGLAHIHQLTVRGRRARMIHRDLKPGNLLVDREGIVHIADLGLARLSAPTPSDADGDLQGTPAYMSPEQVREEPLDGRSDLFSLGVVLYEAATGKRLFNGTDLGTVLTQVSLVDTRLQEFVHQERLSALDPTLREILCKTLQGDRDKRWSSSLEFLDALQILRGQFRGGDPLRDVLRHHPELQTAFVAPPPVAELPPSHPRPPRPSERSDADVFVGRTEEARRIASAFRSREHVVTLKGPGGVGKTRLARETMEAWPAGEAVLFCDLVEVRTLPGLLLAMTSTLGIPLLADSREEQVRQVGHALAEAGPGLVVLDNLEQLVQVVAPALETWRQTAPETCFLATSRQKVGLEEEHVVELGPLSLEEGRELFQERIPIARRDSTLALLTPTVLDEIVTRLDAMPLALELAAAWVGLVMPDELLAGLEKRFRMLRGGKRGAREKDATLEGTLDWSWNLLEPWEQDALAQLSVFRGGFTLESAGSVLDLTSHADAPWVLHVVESLYDKSLVFSRPTESGPRFGLYESIREYVGARLETLGGKSNNRARFARIRHAEHISSLGAPAYLATLNRAGGNAARQVLVTEIENLLEAASTGVAEDRTGIATQAALAAVAALEAIGPLELALNVVEKARGMRGLTDIQRTQLLSAQGRLLHLLGKTEEGIDTGLLAVAALEHLDSLEVEVEVRFHLYLQFLQFGKLDEARLQLRAGLEKAGAQESVTAPLHEGLGVWHLRCGEYHEAALQLHDALLISREAGDWNTESLVLSDLGKLRREQGLQEEAERYTLASLERYREAGDIFMEGRELSSLSLLYQELGRMEDARAATHKALALARRVGDVRSTASILSNQAILYQTRGHIEEALAHYLEALALQERTDDVRGQGITLGNLGALEMDHGDPERALEHLHEALKLHEKLKNRRFIAMTWGNIGDCHLRCDRRAEARAALEKSISMAQEVGWGAAEGAFRGVLSDLESQEDNLARGLELAKRAEELLEAAGHAIELSKARCRRAHLLLRSGDRDAAKGLLEQVEEQCESMGIQPDSALGKRISKLRSAF